MLLELMKTNQVARTVIIQPICYRWDNRYVADSVRNYVPYFKAVCRVNPLDPAAPDHLSNLAVQGFRGVRLSPAADPSGDWIKGPLMPPLWKRAEALKVPMLILTAITRIPEVGRLIERCPDLDVVIDHTADCPVDQRRPRTLQQQYNDSVLFQAEPERSKALDRDVWRVGRCMRTYCVRRDEKKK